MSEDINNLNKEGKSDKAWWHSVMMFYIKTAGWVMIPLILSMILGNYVKQSTKSQLFFFGTVMLGFAVTCYGIYREIREYKKSLDNKNL